MRFTHLFFDLHGTLIDSDALHPCYSKQLARVMTDRYGLTPDVWDAAHRRIFADWDSYYADLDLGGDDGMRDMWEGMYRTTRALFRLAGVEQPPVNELTQLSRDLPGLITRGCDAAFPDAGVVLRDLSNAGFVLGVASHALEAQARGLLIGAGFESYFEGVVAAPDNIGQFLKDKMFFIKVAQMARVKPANCLVVDDRVGNITGARSAGMGTAFVHRKPEPHPDIEVDFMLIGGLSELVRYINPSG